MTKDNLLFTLCGFLLGLILGTMVLGPRVAQSKLAAAAPAAGPVAAAPASADGGGNPMGAVFQQLNTLKARVAANPNDVEALVQLGHMYSDAVKFPQAIEYYEKALAIRDDPNVRTDLGIAYKNADQPDKALAAFEQVGRTAPDQWQAVFNQIVLLGELRRFDDAKKLMPRLKQLRPGDPDVQRLEQALNNAS